MSCESHLSLNCKMKSTFFERQHTVILMSCPLWKYPQACLQIESEKEIRDLYWDWKLFTFYQPFVRVFRKFEVFEIFEILQDFWGFRQFLRFSKSFQKIFLMSEISWIFSDFQRFSGISWDFYEIYKDLWEFQEYSKLWDIFKTFWQKCMRFCEWFAHHLSKQTSWYYVWHI